ncbi:MAG: transglutaminase-like cysteine peptidase [Gammaproteobacteria bacterium]|nr:transglutaminase-like cysteine peptidase [Gammaproteobacteria bacterium]
MLARAAPALFEQPHALSAPAVVANEFQHVEQVNEFFNRLARIPDRRLWGQEDYWAAPDEVMRVGGGDCEDLAAAKYFSLRELGVPAERLRLVYARVLDIQRQRIEPHVVLWYRPDVDADASREWLVLDSLRSDIRPRTQRGDLLSWLTFNEVQVARLTPSGVENPLGGTELLKPWNILLARHNALDTVALVISIHTL